MRTSTLMSILVILIAPIRLLSQEYDLDRSGKKLSISGQVTISGRPAARAEVQAFQLITTQGSPQLIQASRGLSDDEGHYQIDGLTSGTYYLFAKISQVNQEQLLTASAEEQPRIGFYYQTSSLMNAESIDLDEKEESIVPIEITRHSDFTVAGQMMDLPENALIQLWFRGRNSMKAPSPFQAKYNQSNGRFEFKHIPSGSYYIYSTWREGSKTHNIYQPLTVSSYDIKDVRIISSGTHLIFSLSQCGQAVKGVESLYIRPADSDSVRNTESTIAVASTEDKNRFIFENVPPGTYFVHPTLASSYLSLASAVGDDVGNRFTVASGEEVVSMAAEVHCSSSALNGRLRDDSAKRMSTSVILLSHETGERFDLKADAQGRFALHGVAPGDYTIFAFPLRAQYQRDISLLFREHLGQHISLAPGETTYVEVSTSEIE